MVPQQGSSLDLLQGGEPQLPQTLVAFNTFFTNHYWKVNSNPAQYLVRHILSVEAIWCWRFQSYHPLIFPVFKIFTGSKFVVVCNNERHFCGTLGFTSALTKINFFHFIFSNLIRVSLFPKPSFHIFRVIYKVFFKWT